MSKGESLFCQFFHLAIGSACAIAYYALWGIWAAVGLTGFYAAVALLVGVYRLGKQAA